MGYKYSWSYNKTIKTWLDDPNRISGISVDGLKYIERLSACNREFAKCAKITYFLLYNCSDDYTNRANYGTMTRSLARQRTFIGAVLHDLSLFKVVTPDMDYRKIFERDITKIENRCNHVRTICKENIRLSSFYPYFEQHGFFDVFNDELMISDSDEYFDRLRSEIKSWNSEHEKEVSDWLEKIEEEKRISYEYHKSVREKGLAEKKARKEEMKAQKEYENEILKNKRQEASRQRKLERSYNHLYKDVNRVIDQDGKTKKAGKI